MTTGQQEAGSPESAASATLAGVDVRSPIRAKPEMQCPSAPGSFRLRRLPLQVQAQDGDQVPRRGCPAVPNPREHERNFVGVDVRSPIRATNSDTTAGVVVRSPIRAGSKITARSRGVAVRSPIRASVSSHSARRIAGACCTHPKRH